MQLIVIIFLPGEMVVEDGTIFFTAEQMASVCSSFSIPAVSSETITCPISLGLLKSGHGRTIAEFLRLQLYCGRLCACFDYCLQGFPFMLGITFDRFYKVLNKISSALQGRLHVRPSLENLFFLYLQRVISTATAQKRWKHQKTDNDDTLQKLFLTGMLM